MTLDEAIAELIEARKWLGGGTPVHTEDGPVRHILTEKTGEHLAVFIRPAWYGEEEAAEKEEVDTSDLPV
jgi:hypothetical protein